jgi:heptosyltransferase-1
MKILIVKLGAFGDMIHALPAMDDVLRRPEVDELHFLADSRYAFVTRAFPKAIRVHIIDTKGRGALATISPLLQSLRNMRFDAVLELQGLIKSSLLARLISPHVYGMDRAYCRERVSSWLTHPVRFHPDERHVVQQYRRVATGPFVSDIKTRPRSPIPYQAPFVQLTDRMRTAGSSVMDDLGLQAGHYVILHLGGGWATKILPERTWREVAEGIIGKKLTPVFGWGTKAERDVARKIGERIRGSIVLPRRLEMEALCGLLAAARAVIGADTGVLHLAAALGTNTATFWGPSASWRSGPLARPHIHVEAKTECGPCFKRKCDNFICMDRIQARDLLKVVHDH